MTPERMIRLAGRYQKVLLNAGIKPKSVIRSSCLSQLSKEEVLGYALYLIDQFLFLDLKKQPHEAGLQLGIIQACLSFGGRYSVRELIDHLK